MHIGATKIAILASLVSGGMNVSSLAGPLSTQTSRVLRDLSVSDTVKNNLAKQSLIDEVVSSQKINEPLSVPAAIVAAQNSAINKGNTAAVNQRIVGGVFATSAEIPWQVALILSGYPISSGQFCGGSIIDNQWIVTAAHCVDRGMAPGKIYAVVGHHNLGEGAKHVRVEIASIHVHPSWNSATQQHDIALLKLKQPLVFGPTIAKAKLPTQSSNVDMPAPGAMLKASGYGNTTEGGASSPLLRKVIVPVVRFDICSAAYNNEVLPGMFCAGVGGKDTCQGDSGGPIVLGDVQVGVVSWGWGCARVNQPGVYTNTSQYADWVRSTAGL